MAAGPPIGGAPHRTPHTISYPLLVLQSTAAEPHSYSLRTQLLSRCNSATSVAVVQAGGCWAGGIGGGRAPDTGLLI